MFLRRIIDLPKSYQDTTAVPISEDQALSWTTGVLDNHKVRREKVGGVGRGIRIWDEQALILVDQNPDCYKQVTLSCVGSVVVKTHHIK